MWHSDFQVACKGTFQCQIYGQLSCKNVPKKPKKYIKKFKFKFRKQGSKWGSTKVTCDENGMKTTYIKIIIDQTQKIANIKSKQAISILLHLYCLSINDFAQVHIPAPSLPVTTLVQRLYLFLLSLLIYKTH